MKTILPTALLLIMAMPLLAGGDTYSETFNALQSANAGARQSTSQNYGGDSGNELLQAIEQSKSEAREEVGPYVRWLNEWERLYPLKCPPEPKYIEPENPEYDRINSYTEDAYNEVVNRVNLRVRAYHDAQILQFKEKAKQFKQFNIKGEQLYPDFAKDNSPLSLLFSQTLKELISSHSPLADGPDGWMIVLQRCATKLGIKPTSQVQTVDSAIAAASNQLAPHPASTPIVPIPSK